MPAPHDPADEPALDEGAVADDPVVAFRAWLDAAWAAGLPEPRAATVATADTAGRPSARTMILRGVDERGFVFFTGHESRKGQELAANPHAALVFHWQPLQRQVTVAGPVVRLDAAEADRCFAGRPRGAQLAAWAWPQSSVVPGRGVLEERFAEAVARFEGGEVPRPPSWGGFRVVPERVELWQQGADRLHDRLCYRRAGDAWVMDRLGP